MQKLLTEIFTIVKILKKHNVYNFFAYLSLVIFAFCMTVFLIMMQRPILFASFFVCYVAAVNFLYVPLQQKVLWIYIEGEKKFKSQKLNRELGLIEQIIYAVCFVCHAWTFIGIWLGIKVAYRLLPYTNIFGAGPTNRARDKKLSEESQKRNIFLIGNITSLFWGLMTGFLMEIFLNYSKYSHFLNSHNFTDLINIIIKDAR